MLSDTERGPEPLRRRDRDDLIRIAKTRAKIARSEIEGRKAELMIDVERQLAAKYDFGDERWQELTDAAQLSVNQANERIREEFERAGVPTEFAPYLNVGWYSRGETGASERRAELRKVAKAELDAKGKQAKIAIDRSEADVITDLLALTMAAEAKGRIESLPSIENLLMAPSVAELESVAETSRRSQRGGRR